MAPRRRNTGDYLDGVLKELLKHAPRAITHARPTSVHHARVATRRLGAGVKILHPLLPQESLEPFAKALKRIRKSLGDLRDLDVMQDHLGELERKYPVARRAIDILHCRRNDLTRDLRGDGKLQDAITVLRDWPRLANTLASSATVPLLRASISQQFSDFSARADELGAALKSGTGQLQPHALRIAGKSLRYALEMASAEELPVSDLVTRYKAMQDALGLWHDHHVLALETLKQARDDLRQPASRTDEDQMIALAATIVRRGQSSLKQFAQLWRKGRQALSQGIIQVTDRRQADAT